MTLLESSRDLSPSDLRAVNKALLPLGLRFARPKEDIKSKAHRILEAGEAHVTHKRMRGDVHVGWRCLVIGSTDGYLVEVDLDGKTDCPCVNPKMCSHRLVARVLCGFEMEGEA